jgi:hypothetical protein
MPLFNQVCTLDQSRGRPRHDRSEAVAVKKTIDRNLLSSKKMRYLFISGAEYEDKPDNS